MSFVVCPLCETTQVVPVARHLDFNAAQIYFCQACRHWFAYPEPASAWLDQYYREIYSPQRRRYFSEAYYLLMERRAAAQIDFIRQQLPGKTLASLRNCNAIDLGCGVGALVAALEQAGLNAVGYDSDHLAITIGRQRWQANIHVGTLSDHQLLHESFDLLCMSHLVEHLADLCRTLAAILQLLRPGGYLLIEVPDCFTELFTANVDTESHLHFFTRSSLVKLCTALGLQVLACVSCGPPKLLSGQVGAIHQHAQSPGVARSPLLAGLSRVKRKFGRLLRPSGQTAYDGYYDRYYRDDEPGGIWLRCLARKL